MAVLWVLQRRVFLFSLLSELSEMDYVDFKIFKTHLLRANILKSLLFEMPLRTLDEMHVPD